MFLVNNAGVNFVRPFEELSSADWDRVIGVDLRGTFSCTRACIEQFLRQGFGQRGQHCHRAYDAPVLPGAAPYDAAKMGPS